MIILYWNYRQRNGKILALLHLKDWKYFSIIGVILPNFKHCNYASIFHVNIAYTREHIIRILAIQYMSNIVSRLEMTGKISCIYFLNYKICFRILKEKFKLFLSRIFQIFWWQCFLFEFALLIKNLTQRIVCFKKSSYPNLNIIIFALFIHGMSIIK